jgi:hypothetical protein
MDEMVMANIIGSGVVMAEPLSPSLGIAGSLFRFVPTETFENVMNGETSVYVEGQKYTVRPDNTAFRSIVEDWILTGKVERIK